MPVPVVTPFVPWLATAGFGWLYYRRIRRHFGRQVYQPKRALFRLVILGIVACLLVVAAAMLPHVALGVVAGAVVGVALGVFGLRHTRTDVVGGVPEYVPNPWIGAVLSVLLIGRLAWRWQSGAFAAGAAQAGSQASPLTLAFMATLIAYYLVYGIGLRRRLLALQAERANAVAPDRPESRL